MKQTNLGKYIYSFFEDYLKCQKGLQSTSIISYSDTMRLFLEFVAKDSRRKITHLKLSDMTGKRVRKFLQFLEDKRNNKIQTRNQRLAALRTFFEYLSGQSPVMLSEAQQVAIIPVKRTSPPETFYLERNEIEQLLVSLPSSGPLALRDQTLLLFLYNTGARAGETAQVRVKNLNLDSQTLVHLHGKGNKWRVCPLWKRTANLLIKLLEEKLVLNKPDSPVFTSRLGRPLTRFGIYKIIRKHTSKLVKNGLDGKHRYISPHIFRHTTAVHLLESGVEVNVIGAWLGHSNLESTNRYAEITLRMKEEALKTCEPPINDSELQKAVIWRDDSSLLKWLKSL